MEMEIKENPFLDDALKAISNVSRSTHTFNHCQLTLSLWHVAGKRLAFKRAGALAVPGLYLCSILSVWFEDLSISPSRA